MSRTARYAAVRSRSAIRLRMARWRSLRRRVWMSEAMTDWKEHGIRIVRAGELDSNTPQTPGMTRAAAITHARTGANKLWAGTVTVQPAARTGVCGVLE